MNVEYTDVPVGKHHLHNYTSKHYTEDAMTLTGGSLIGVYEDWLRTLSKEELDKEYDLVLGKLESTANSEDGAGYAAWYILVEKVEAELDRRRK